MAKSAFCIYVDIDEDDAGHSTLIAPLLALDGVNKVELEFDNEDGGPFNVEVIVRADVADDLAEEKLADECEKIFLGNPRIEDVHVGTLNGVR